MGRCFPKLSVELPACNRRPTRRHYGKRSSRPKGSCIARCREIGGLRRVFIAAGIFAFAVCIGAIVGTVVGGSAIRTAVRTAIRTRSAVRTAIGASSSLLPEPAPEPFSEPLSEPGPLSPQSPIRRQHFLRKSRIHCFRVHSRSAL